MISNSVLELQEQILQSALKSNRDPKDLTLITISKTFGSNLVEEAFNTGLVNFGENYVQELLEKKEKLNHLNINWHFVGHLQTNKVKFIAPFISMIQSVDSKHIAEEINLRAQQNNRKIKILVEVNTSKEATKFGVNPENTIQFLTQINHLKFIEICGLMTIGPFTENQNESRKAFKILKEIRDEANKLNIIPNKLLHLSMGMTHDYKIAIDEGATILRIGTAIFGKRIKNNL
ncbi:MAG: YggS family pyridoxal phosphate-dependent enzyme [Bacteroidetes bacterium]|nr:YggS family pyridoxal phosphate-dependent enzyme [Bacteroidota bacterium]